MLGKEPFATTICWPVLFHGVCKDRTINIKQMYVFIHSECLFLTRVPLSYMQIPSYDSHMEWECSSSLSVYESLEEKRLFHGLSPL